MGRVKGDAMPVVLAREAVTGKLFARLLLRWGRKLSGSLARVWGMSYDETTPEET